MSKRLQYRRLMLLMVLVCLAFAGLGYRLVDLQVLRHEELLAKAQQNTQREYLFEPRRGDILDVKGNPLATTIYVKTVCADPTLMANHQAEVAHVLAPLLQVDEKLLTQSLSPRVRQTEHGESVTNRYVRLKQKVPLETWAQIRAAMTNLSFGVDEKALRKTNSAAAKVYENLREKAIFARDDQKRVYPNQRLAAHVLGYTSIKEREVNDTPVREIVGCDGIERNLNTKLAGVRGWRLTETDHQRRELVTLREQDMAPQDGLNVVLTIDAVIQQIVETALSQAMEKHQPISITGLVMRPRTGEILAWPNLPNFDPNDPGAKDTKEEDRRNRIITDIAEPGSTFKIVVVSSALNDGLVRLTDLFDCEHGHFAFGGRTLHDHEAYGTLSVEKIITKSSNIGAAKVGIKMGENRLYRYIRNYGFGERTGIPLPGEVGGIVHPVKAWSKVHIAQIPMGQGISVTRLQMALAMGAIANNGVLMQPMLVDRLEDQDHNVVAKFPPQRVRQVISETAAKEMVKALKTVVSPEGTAPKAALEHYTVAGKTGTAQKVENGAYVHKYFASFIGFFPADNPELCIAVSLDDPKHGGYYGGLTAGPVFKQIAEQAASYLNIRPEDDNQLNLTNTVTAASEKSFKAAVLRSPKNQPSTAKD